MAVTNNGKKSEAKIQAALKQITLDCFDWCRLYDATSARNAFMSQVGDFLFFLPNVHGVFEVKSLKHPYRLPKTSFSSNQLAKLLTRSKAGGHVFIIVHHWEQDIWRLIPLQEILTAFQDEQKSSIDLRQASTFDTATQVIVAALTQAST